MPEVVVSQLTKDFGSVRVLDEVSFTIADGEFFTLLGPSGCGKSTTLNCIAGLERPSSGRISVGSTTFVDTAAGTFLETEERNLGMVFQSYALWPHKTVAQNVAFPLQVRKASRSDQKLLVDDALDKVGLLNLSDRFPHQLSGGQQQRVALARALVYSPGVLLLDEPLSNLDARLREQAREWLKRLQGDLGITTVYVTHDQDEALALSDRIAVMSNGRPIQIGTPVEIYEKPASTEVAAFVGNCNFLGGRIERVESDFVRVRLESGGVSVAVTSHGGLNVDDEVTVAVRPEKLSVSASSSSSGQGGTNVLSGTVLTRSYLGSRYEYTVGCGQEVLQIVSDQPQLRYDVELSFNASDALVYKGRSPAAVEVEELQSVA